MSTIKKTGTWRSVPLYAYLVVVALLVVAPVLFAFIGAFTPTGTILGGDEPWLTTWTLDNFATAFRTSPLVAQFINSVVVTAAQTALQLVTSVMAAYALVFGRLPRPDLVLGFFLVTMMIPSETTIIANYLTIRSLGLFDTLVAVFLPFATSAFAIFLFRQAFKSFSKDCRIDAGRSHHLKSPKFRALSHDSGDFATCAGWGTDGLMARYSTV